MTKEIVYTDEYALILSDEEIIANDWLYGYMNNNVFKANRLCNLYVNSKKIAGHLPLSDAPILEGVPLLPPLPPESNLLKLLDLLGEITSDNPPPIEEVKRKRDEAKQQRPTHFEGEMEVVGITDDGVNTIDEPKIISNSQGQLEFVGKYLTKN